MHVPINVKSPNNTSKWQMWFNSAFNPLNAKLNPICHLMALLGAHQILHVSRIRVKELEWHRPQCVKRHVPVCPVVVYVTMHGDLTLILLTWRIGWAPNIASRWQNGFNLAFKGLNNSRRHRRPKHVGVLSHVCKLLSLIKVQLWEYILCGVKFVTIISHLDVSFTTSGLNHRPFMTLDLHSGKCVYVYLCCVCASTLFRIAESGFISFEVKNPKNRDTRNGIQHAAPCINCIHSIYPGSVWLENTHINFWIDG